MRGMRRSVLVGALLAAGGTTAAIAAPHTQSANRASAATDAGRLLSRLVLPADATASASEPSGDGGRLARPVISTGPMRVIDRHGWWTVAGAPAQVTSFLRAHRPAGSRWSARGSSTAPGMPAETFVSATWSAVSGMLGLRQLTVALVPLAGGGTGIRADAQVQWIVPRPAAERIPGRARVLDVTVAAPGRAPLLARTFTGRRRVSGVAALLDRQPIVQPGTIVSCPGLPARQPVVSFTFRAAPAGPALARATVPAIATDPDSVCHPITLTIGRRREPALLGGPAVVRGAQRVLGVRLAHTA